jgi:hypothetical protein
MEYIPYPSDVNLPVDVGTILVIGMAKILGPDGIGPHHADNSFLWHIPGKNQLHGFF